MTLTMPTPRSSCLDLRLGWPWMVLFAALAALVRTCNLGTFSLWLDEILIMQRAQGGLVEAWRSCLANAEHPPLTALVMALGNRMGLSDAAHAVVPEALGVGTVLLLAVWTGHHLGRRPGIIVGLLAAVSPVHLRYSQELRPYSYLLFFTVLTLVLMDHLLDRPSWRRAASLACTMVLGLHSHIQYPLVLVPASIVVAGWLLSHRSEARRVAVMIAIALAAAVLAYAPWMVASTRTLATRPAAGGTADWSWRLAGERWEFLTVAARYGDDLSAGGVAMLLATVIGAAVAWRRSAGLAALAAVVVGSVGIEAALLAAGHWTHGRYSLMAWPFLMVLVALGVDRTFALRRSLGWLACLVLAVVHIRSIGEYQRIGRPSWDRLAEVVSLLYHDGDVLLTENLQCRISLGYHLETAGYEHLHPESIDGDLGQLGQMWPADRTCLLVVGRHPAFPEVRSLLDRFPVVVEHYNTARLYRLTPADRAELVADEVEALAPVGPFQGWPEPNLWLLPSSLLGDHGTCLQRLRRRLWPPAPPPPTTRLDFDAGWTAGALVGSWSGFERTPEGTTFVWAVGREAGIVLQRSAAADLLLTVRLWPHVVPGRTQHVRGMLNGHVVGEAALQPGPQELSVAVPSSWVRAGPNLLVLQAAYAVAPADVSSDSTDRRQLSFAVDWLEIRQTEP